MEINYVTELFIKSSKIVSSSLWVVFFFPQCPLDLNQYILATESVLSRQIPSTNTVLSVYFAVWTAAAHGV